MGFDDSSDIFRATITHFDVISIEELVEVVVAWKMFVDEFQEAFCHVCLDVFVEWWVEPNSFSFAVAASC